MLLKIFLWVLILAVVAVGVWYFAGGSDSLSSKPAACSQAPDAGNCRAYMPRYFFDADSGSCKEFIWGGCGGSVPFETKAACETACR